MVIRTIFIRKDEQSFNTKGKLLIHFAMYFQSHENAHYFNVMS